MCIPHAQCWFFFGNSCWCSLDLLCPGFEVDTDRLLYESVYMVVVSQLLGQSAPLGSECLEEKVEVSPRIETDGRGSDRESEEENGG